MTDALDVLAALGGAPAWDDADAALATADELPMEDAVALRERDADTLARRLGAQAPRMILIAPAEDPDPSPAPGQPDPEPDPEPDPDSDPDQAPR